MSSLIHSPPGPSHEDCVGRPMVRYLLDTYSMQQIQKLLQEEACEMPLLPSQSSPLQEDDAGDDVDSTSPEFEPSPIPTGSIFFIEPSLGTLGTAFKPTKEAFFARPAAAQQRQEMLTAEEALLNLANDSVAENTGDLRIEKPTKKKEYICGFCSEYGIYKRLSRPSDLKRHLESTHHTNTLWVCPKANCRRVFQWLGAFKEHARYYHKVRVRIYDAEVITLCPQTVFACGFEGCSQVYEAPSEFEVSPARDTYIAHVVTHLQSILDKPRAWSFTCRMRNLLRQSGLSNIWRHLSPRYDENQQLNWDARSSSVLQKLLETRHLGSPIDLMRNAIALGSVECREVQLAQGNAVLPILGECQAEVHQIDLPADMPADMPAVQATPSPAEPGDDTAESATANCSESLVAPNHSDALQSVYRLEHSHQDAMQEILDSLHDQPVEQQYLSEDFTDPMEWIENNDEEGNDII